MQKISFERNMPSIDEFSGVFALSRNPHDCLDTDCCGGWRAHLPENPSVKGLHLHKPKKTGDNMLRQIFCIKLNENAEGLESPPMPGELGEKIFNHISKVAWQQWLSHQTMLINEYRLSSADKKARTYLKEQMQAFLFGEGAEKPTGYKPEN